MLDCHSEFLAFLTKSPYSGQMIETITRQPPQLTPKNSRHLIVLLAGGPADRAREIKQALADRRGVDAKYHWDYERPHEFSRPIPQDVDLVILLKTMISHPLHDLVMRAAKKAGVPVVRTSHKWGVMDLALRQRFRITKLPPLPANPVVTPAPEPPPLSKTPQQTTEAELRQAQLKKDTLVLIREIQARLPSLGVTSVLIDLTQVTMATAPAILMEPELLDP